MSLNSPFSPVIVYFGVSKSLLIPNSETIFMAVLDSQPRETTYVVCTPVRFLYVNSEKHKISSEALPRLTANVFIERFIPGWLTNVFFPSTTTIGISQRTNCSQYNLTLLAFTSRN